MREEPVEEGKGVEVRRVRLRIRGYGVRELSNVRCSISHPWRSHPRTRTSSCGRASASGTGSPVWAQRALVHRCGPRGVAVWVLMRRQKHMAWDLRRQVRGIPQRLENSRSPGAQLP